MRRAAFRCDAGAALGGGHLMRCLTLAQALSARGWGIEFLCREQPGAGLDRVTAAGFDLHRLSDDRPQTARACLKGDEAVWLIVDHYGLDAAFQRAACPPGWRVMAIDDLADRKHDCALLLDQAPGRAAGDYDGRVPDGAARLIGPDYALLRPGFAVGRPVLPEAGPLRQVLVAMGAADPANATGAVLDALAARGDLMVTVVLGSGAPHLVTVAGQVEARGEAGRLLVQHGDMAGLMAQQDLAIGAGGMTGLERAAIGLPALIVTLADNQSLAASALHASGAARLIGDVRAPQWSEAILPALDAVAPPENRINMARPGLDLVDGRGAGRVAETLDAPSTGDSH
ncbi:MAG: UDP-2,4-diacetamido-2,4,6-trideoxy-beta-L-altropyranose hydrolase [Oceanicaulis sp.]|nr:UDP-2,4-diacetamido-2,4,6-trideoxy-beta-L-altropyranose hydrolase [Oceanicaulis sp.]